MPAAGLERQFRHRAIPVERSISRVRVNVRSAPCRFGTTVPAMSAALVITLSVLAGVLGYASLHHALVGFARPRNETHLLFALWSLLFAVYVASRIGSYRAGTV